MPQRRGLPTSRKCCTCTAKNHRSHFLSHVLMLFHNLTHHASIHTSASMRTVTTPTISSRHANPHTPEPRTNQERFTAHSGKRLESLQRLVMPTRLPKSVSEFARLFKLPKFEALYPCCKRIAWSAILVKRQRHTSVEGM